MNNFSPAKIVLRLAIGLCALLGFNLRAESCSDWINDRHLSRQTTVALVDRIQALEGEVERRIGRGDGVLYMTFCGVASKVLKELLETQLRFKTTIVSTTIMGDQHYLLLVPNYFGWNEHLYIDPTLQQFGTNYVLPKIFVGSRHELRDFAAARGVYTYFTNFYEEYVALKSHPASPYEPFVNSERLLLPAP